MEEWRDRLDEAEALCDEGLQMLDGGSMHRARTCFFRATEIAPDYVEAWLSLGRYYQKMNLQQDAMLAFREAIRLDPENPAPLCCLGECYLAMDRPAMAVAHFHEAQRLAPDDPDILGALGRACGAAHFLEDAEHAFQAALACDSTHLDSLLGMARLAYERGDYSDVLCRLDEVLAMDPELAAAHLLRAGALEHVGRVKEAHDALRLAIFHDPDDPLPHYHLGRLLKDRGDADEALASLDHAVHLAPDFLPAAVIRGILRFQQGQRDQALACFREALDHHPDNADLLFNEGLVLQDLNRPEEAVEAFRRAVAANPDSPEARVSLAWNLRQTGALAECITMADSVLAQDAANPGALLAKAIAHEELEQWPQAAAAMQQLLACLPGNVPAMMALADLHARNGNHARAEASLRDVLGQDPQNAEAHYRLGLHLQRHGLGPEVAVEALDHLASAHRCQPAVARYAAELGSALVRAGRHREALSTFEVALAQQALDAHQAMHHAEALAATGAVRRALITLARLRRASPADPSIYMAIAACHRAAGDTLGEFEALEAALDREPTHTDSLLRLEELAPTRGHRSRVAMALRRAVGRGNRDPRVLTASARLHARHLRLPTARLHLAFLRKVDPGEAARFRRRLGSGMTLGAFAIAAMGVAVGAVARLLNAMG